MSFLSYYRDDDFFFHKSIDTPHERTSYGMHAHDIYEIFFLVSGDGQFVAEGNAYPLIPGCIALVRRGEAHHIVLNPKTTYERIVIHFFPDVVTDIDEKHLLLAPFEQRPLGQKNYYLPSAQSEITIQRYFDNILEADGDSYRMRLSLHTNLFSILNELGHMFENNTQTHSDITNQRISEILTYINQHLFEPLSVEILCRKFYISKAHLNDLFKRHTSSTVWNYIRTKRLIYARNLIRAGTPATTAGSQCGFNEYSTFFRAYKKQFGQAPTDF